VLVRQRILVAAHGDDDVLLPRRRIATELDREFGHGSSFRGAFLLAGLRRHALLERSKARLKVRGRLRRVLLVELLNELVQGVSFERLLLDYLIAQPFELLAALAQIVSGPGTGISNQGIELAVDGFRLRSRDDLAVSLVIAEDTQSRCGAAHAQQLDDARADRGQFGQIAGATAEAAGTAADVAEQQVLRLDAAA
jgi:hypothetical protein